MLELNSDQVFELAAIMLHEAHPNLKPLILQPTDIKEYWIREAENAIDGYEIVVDYLNRK